MPDVDAFDVVATRAAVNDEVREDLGEILAGNYLYHFVVRRYARALLGEPDELGIPCSHPACATPGPAGPRASDPHE